MNHSLVTVDFKRPLALFAGLITVFVVHQLHQLLVPPWLLNSSLHLLLCYCLLIRTVVLLAVAVVAIRWDLEGVKRLIIIRRC